MDNNRTSQGLRDRLFTALDLFMDKKVTSKEIEGICYLSEQIIKTANVELEFQKTINEEKRSERDHLLRMKREEAVASERLQLTLQKAEEIEGA